VQKKNRCYGELKYWCTGEQAELKQPVLNPITNIILKRIHRQSFKRLLWVLST